MNIKHGGNKFCFERSSSRSAGQPIDLVFRVFRYILSLNMILNILYVSIFRLDETLKYSIICQLLIGY